MKETGRTIWFVKTPVPIQMIRTVSLETDDVLSEQRPYKGNNVMGKKTLLVQNKNVPETKQTIKCYRKVQGTECKNANNMQQLSQCCSKLKPKHHVIELKQH